MGCITIDSGTRRFADSDEDNTERSGIVTSLRRAFLRLVSVCRSGATLAMMSERDLDDLGLLPWDVRSGADAGAFREERGVIRHPKPCLQT